VQCVIAIAYRYGSVVRRRHVGPIDVTATFVGASRAFAADSLGDNGGNRYSWRHSIHCGNGHRKLPSADSRSSMQRLGYRLRTACRLVAVAATLACAPGVADAARVAVLSNAYFNETAADFTARVAGHTFTAIDVSASVPALATLTANFDVILLFEDATFSNSTAVGNRVASFAQTGRPVVVGTFYDQDRSDAPTSLPPHGWGALESIDPNTTDGTGTPYAPRSLDFASIVPHPLTAGVTALSSNKWAGGNQAKAGTIVVASWQQTNARGLADPAIAYRITGPACVIHIAIAPSYPILGVAGTDFGGNFYTVWKNAFDFGAAGCVSAAENTAFPIPTLSDAALALTALLLVALGAMARRRQRR
jgi:IPTL-CTERM motif